MLVPRPESSAGAENLASNKALIDAVEPIPYGPQGSFGKPLQLWSSLSGGKPSARNPQAPRRYVNTQTQLRQHL